VLLGPIRAYIDSLHFVISQYFHSIPFIPWHSCNHHARICVKMAASRRNYAWCFEIILRSLSKQNVTAKRLNFLRCLCADDEFHLMISQFVY